MMMLCYWLNSMYELEIGGEDDDDDVMLLTQQ
jgi:hypothetical protein